MTSPSRVVVTALMGGYETLSEQPIAGASGLQFVCVTDDPALTSQTWTVRHAVPLLPCDPVRSARDVKLRVHRYVPEADEVLWIDNSVLLTVPPEDLLDAWLAHADVWIPQHSFRGPVAEEFAEVAALGLDDTARIFEQYAHYRIQHPDVLETQTLWTAILARRMGAPGVREFGECWMEQVLRYSRRDQLSVTTALHRTGPRVSSPPMDNFDSFAHSWPVVAQRRSAITFRKLDFIPESLADARLKVDGAQARSEIADLQARLADAAQERADLANELADLQARLADAAQERADLVTELAAATAEVAVVTAEQQPLIQAKEQLQAVLASRSFRLTAGPRRLASSTRSALGRRLE